MAQLSQRFKIVAQNLMQRGFTASCIPREQGRSGGGATADSGDDGSCRRLLRPSPWPAAPRRQLLKRYDKAMQLFDPAAILTDSKLAQQLLQHRPQVPVISAQELLQDDVPVEG